MTARLALSLVTSTGTLAGMWLVSKKRWQGWAVGLANQVVWLALIVATRTWGLLLLTVALVVIYTRALLEWKDDQHLDTTEAALATDLLALHNELGWNEIDAPATKSPEHLRREAAIWRRHGYLPTADLFDAAAVVEEGRQ